MPLGRRSVRRIRAVLIVVAAVGMALAPSVVCATDGPMTNTQMACCIAMGHDCEIAGDIAECCPPDTQKPQSIVTIKAASLQPAAAPLLMLAPATARTSALIRVDGRALALQGSPPRGRTVPTYLRLSSLLI